MRLGLDLVVLIVQDNAYGMIRWKQAVDKLPDRASAPAEPPQPEPPQPEPPEPEGPAPAT